MTSAPHRTTYIGLFFVALATLMYEILLTRIFSVTLLYHFAFVALSLAMFGMTAGALAVYLAPRLFPPDRLDHRLAAAAVAFPIVLVWSFLTQLSIPFQVYPSVVAIYGVVLTYAVIAVPFFTSGIVVCLALTGFPRAVGRLYAADLGGAALGCVLLILVLDWSDGPTAVLWIALLASVGGVALATTSGSGRLRRVAIGTSIVLAVAAIGHTILVWRGTPVFRILYTKASPLVEPRPLYDKWNSYSRVRVTGHPDRLSPPIGWGLSQTLPSGIELNQLQLDIDVWAGTTMTRFTGDLEAVRHLAYDITNIGYYLRPQPNALVIGAGGGRDVLSALAFGARTVTAVDINRNIIDTVNGRYGDFTGHLDRIPGVRFVNDEARSFVARSPERFTTIQISLIDTWAATAAGAFVLGENSLYTVEAWTTFLDHLEADGMLSVSRWYFLERPAELYRTTTLAVEALRRLGVTDVRRHIAIVRNTRPWTSWTEAGERPDGVGTILVGRRPFTDADLDTLERESARLQFDLPFTPRAATDPTFVQLTGSGDLRAFLDAYPINITAPTDDSPFFFNMLRLRDIGRASLLEFGALSHNMKAVATLGALCLAVTLLTGLCILLPLWQTRQRIRLAGATPLLVFFIAIGLGFMLVETSQMQRLIIALGHPTYGLSVVLFAMLLSSGIGSYLTAGVDDSGRGRNRLVALVVVLALFGLITPAVTEWSAPLSTPLRIVAAVLLLFPAGLFMGMAFPLGMTLAAARARELTPWLWGLNGAASVLASVLSVCIALTWSISSAFWTGWACYVAALAAFVVAGRRTNAGEPVAR